LGLVLFDLYYLSNHHMKNFLTTSMKLFLIISLAFLGSCTTTEDPAPVVENAISSEDYVEGIYIVGFNEDAIPVHFETTNPAIFSAHPSKKSFDIHSSGQGNFKLEEGSYWINYHFADEPSKVHILPVLVTKNKPYAKEAIAAIKKMKDEPAGYTLILRHGHSDVGDDKTSTGPEWYKSCDSKIARQMSQKGIDDSKRIGSTIKSLNIPVGATTTSQYCRAIKTFEYMNLGLPIIQDARLNHENSNPKIPMYDDVEDIIKETASPNGIHIIVGHYNMCKETVFQDLVRPLEMGDGWITKTGADGKVSFVGAVPLFYWDIFL